MAKIHFRPYTPNQTVLFPQRIDEDIAPDAPVRIVNAIVDSLDLDNFRRLYKETGRCPYHPKMMLKAILYAYMNNVYSCRKIEQLLLRDIHYIWLAGYEKPDFITINRFRNRVKDEINNVFTQLVLILYAVAEGDYYVCPMGQHMTRIGTKRGKTASGYITESARYQAQRCEGCPLRGSCFKARGNRIIEVNHRLNQYKRKVRERLTSEEGVKHRGKRCIEPEAVFGQMKYDMAYRRFRHIGKDKVTMDFAFFAIAFDIKKMCAKIAKEASKLPLDRICRGNTRLRTIQGMNWEFFKSPMREMAA